MYLSSRIYDDTMLTILPMWLQGCSLATRAVVWQSRQLAMRLWRAATPGTGHWMRRRTLSCCSCCSRGNAPRLWCAPEESHDVSEIHARLCLRMQRFLLLDQCNICCVT